MKATSPKIIAKQYAQALYDVAVEAKAVPAVQVDLNGFLEALQGSEKLLHLLNNPVVDQAQKIALIEALIKKGKPHKITANFLRLLVKNSRFDVYAHVVLEFKETADADQGVKHVETITAVKLNKAQENILLERLKSALNANEIVLTNEIDPDILGGIKIRFGSTSIDDTVKNKLNRIAQKMKGAA